MKYLGFLFLLPAWAAPAPGDGVVLGIVGKWQLKSRPAHPAGFGDPVAASDTLYGVRDGSIVIAFPSQSKRFYRKCDAPKCEFNLAGAIPLQPAPSILARVAEALKPYFKDGDTEQRFIAAESRGADGDLDEAVLLLRAGEVDLSPSLRDMAAGTYRLRFEPLARGGGKPARPFRIAWKPHTAAVVTLPGMEAGLVRIAQLDPGTDQPTDNKAWVLLSTSDDYARRAAAFQEVLDATSTWTDELSRSAARAVLRAWLQALADGNAR